MEINRIIKLDEYQDKVARYFFTMIQVKKMLLESIINEMDYHQIEDEIAKKYCIKKSSIYRSIDWI